MPRYLVQKNSYTCGAVALINSFKNMGYKKFTGKDVKPISKKLKSTLAGTYDSYVVKYLKKNKFKVGVQNGLAYSSIRYALKQDKQFILTFCTETHCHYSAVLEVTDKGVWCANNPEFKDYFSEVSFLDALKPRVFYSFEELKYFCVNYKHHCLSLIYFSK